MSIEGLEALDHFSVLRNALRVAADMKEHWAGIPMPLSDQPLVIEPNYPNAQALMKIGQTPSEPSSGEYENFKFRSAFWSTHRRCLILIFDDGVKIEWRIQLGVHSLDQQLQTLGASDAWGIEQESNAIKLLATLVPHHAFKKYMLTGSFLERSRRSGVSYMFRRLRPTVAIKEHKGRMRILCALCLHPIGYYQGSWAGAMCPTDDVIAHLMLMRGDEPMLWRRANQHPAFRPEAGL